MAKYEEVSLGYSVKAMSYLSITCPLGFHSSLRSPSIEGPSYIEKIFPLKNFSLGRHTQAHANCFPSMIWHRQIFGGHYGKNGGVSLGPADSAKCKICSKSLQIEKKSFEKRPPSSLEVAVVVNCEVDLVCRSSTASDERRVVLLVKVQMPTTPI